MSNAPWQWWAGANEEWFTVGPCLTREQAIAEAQSDACGEFEDEDGTWKVGIYVVEAKQEPLKLSEWLPLDDLVDRAEESLADSDRVSYEYDDGPFFDIGEAQGSDLEEMLKLACDEWQEKHGLTFKTNTFSAQRNAGYVVVPHPYPA